VTRRPPRWLVGAAVVAAVFAGILLTAAWTNRPAQLSPRHPADTAPQRVICDSLGTTCIPLEDSPYVMRRQL
jgi:hypothetical protein